MNAKYLEDKVNNNVADILQFQEGLTGVIGFVHTLDKEKRQYVTLVINAGNVDTLSNATVIFLSTNPAYRKIMRIALRKARLLRYKRMLSKATFICMHLPIYIQRWIKR
jgi:hypothetical protein